MTKYAYYNPQTTPVSPVLGWYDTGAVRYPNLPLLSMLFELTDEQWEARMKGTFGIQDGQLVPCPPMPAPT